MGRARDIANVLSSNTALATDAEVAAFGYLTNASASSTYANISNTYLKISGSSSGESSTVNINTKPWNIPWGIQYFNKTITNTVTGGTVAALSTSFNFINNRRYKVSAQINGLFNNGRVLGTISAGSIGTQRFFDISSGSYFNPHGYTIAIGNGTTQNITVGFNVISGSSTLVADDLPSNYHSLLIEDVGPV